MRSPVFRKLRTLPRAIGTAIVLALPTLTAAQTVSSVRTVCDLLTPLSNVGRLASYIVGVIAILVILYAGFLFLTAAGNEDTMKKAKGYLLYGLIGIAVGLLAFNAAPIVSSVIGGGSFESTCVNPR